MKNQLQYIVTNYPNSEIKPQAELLLSHYSDDIIANPNVNENEKVDKTKELYNYNPSSFHLFLLIVDVKTSNINTVRNDLSEHNQKFFKGKNLTISSLFLTDMRQLISVSRFNNKEEAEKYLKVFRNNKDINATLSNNNPITFVISTDNYPVLYKDKNETKYLEFFSKYYMK